MGGIPIIKWLGLGKQRKYENSPQHLSDALIGRSKYDVSDLKKRIFMALSDFFTQSPVGRVMFLIGVIMIPGLSQTYWYSGDSNYIDSFVEVLTERTLQSYISNVTDQFSSMF